MKTELLGNKIEAANKNTGCISSIYFIRDGLKEPIPGPLLRLVSFVFHDSHVIMVDIENTIEAQLDVNWGSS